MRLRRVGMREALERAADTVHWDKPLPSRPGKKVGRGVACGEWRLGGGRGSGAWVKLNEDELRLAASMLDLRGDDERTLAEDLLARFKLGLVAVTRGERGSLLVSDEGASEHAGFRVEVADTIGSGDAFGAALAHCRLRGASLELSNEIANRVGSWVATQPGATPEADAPKVARLLEGLD